MGVRGGVEVRGGVGVAFQLKDVVAVVIIH